MLADVAAVLRCPVCGAAVALEPTALRCLAGHSFDLARQGYVNLLTRVGAGTADTAAMVAARERFLRAGHYAPVLRAVADAVRDAVAARGQASGVAVLLDAVLLDAGAGTGDYLAAALTALPQAVGVALDSSVPAIRQAARAHERIGAVVADVWQRLPIADGAVDVVLNVFAPRNAAEFVRVLRPGGALVVVTPLPAHLAELTGPLGLLSVDPDKDERLRATLGGTFESRGGTEVSGRLRLSRPEALAAVEMGPSAHHVDASYAEVVNRWPEPIEVGYAVRVSSYARL
ncbi:MAG: rRNA (guanine745-N1)-methyltransferase [Frankiaceae bacterium]|nr:rRNA (guanine745-N1)-methyltransferase [Frankiaceae bacterium]